ncbi:MAG: hypothetical protein RLY72_2156, partial [Planctomycetota bacterium]
MRSTTSFAVIPLLALIVGCTTTAPRTVGIKPADARSELVDGN